jgi:hypothetical protein
VLGNCTEPRGGEKGEEYYSGSEDSLEATPNLAECDDNEEGSEEEDEEEYEEEGENGASKLRLRLSCIL